MPDGTPEWSDQGQRVTHLGVTGPKVLTAQSYYYSANMGITILQ